jgi:hypothetical protein
MSRLRTELPRSVLDDLNIEPSLLYRYSLIAARWEAVRLLIDKGKGTSADDRRFAELSHLYRAASEQIGFGAELPSDFLPNDPSRVLVDTWQQAAEIWHAT